MTGKDTPAERLKTAAGWYADLQDEHVPADVWRRFLIWERDPANAAAFRQIEAGLEVLDRSRFARRGQGAPVRHTVVWGSALAVAAALVIGVMLVRAPQPDLPAQAAPSMAEIYATRVGERRDVALADGTVITLNTASRMEVIYSDTARAVTLLEGQALFDVAPGRVPFVAGAGGSLTTALGTEFDIRLRPEGPEIILVEGRVRVARQGDSRSDVLTPGQRLTFRGGDTVITEVDTSEATGWKTGMIRFRDVTLREAIEEMNRYSEVQLSAPDAALAARRFSGVFPAGDQDIFLESILLHFEARALHDGRVITLLPTDKPSAADSP
jgi:transmembrane sensor